MQERKQTESTDTATDTTVMSPVYSQNGMKGRCYYYKGNFFQPMTIHSSSLGPMKKAKRKFMRDNSDMIEADLANPEYRTTKEMKEERREQEFGMAVALCRQAMNAVYIDRSDFVTTQEVKKAVRRVAHAAGVNTERMLTHLDL